VRDYAPRDRGGNINPRPRSGCIPAFRISITKPLPLSSRPLSSLPCNAAVPKGPAFLFLKLLAWKRAIAVFKEPFVRAIESNSLDEHRARRRDHIQGRRRSAALPSEPGLTAVTNEAAPNQTDANAAAARASSPSARAEVTPLAKVLLIGCARRWAATATSGTRGACVVLGRSSAAPSQVDGRSWERHFQRRDAKCATILLNCDS